MFDNLSYMLMQVALEGIKLAEMELQLEVGDTSLSQDLQNECVLLLFRVRKMTFKQLRKS